MSSPKTTGFSFWLSLFLIAPFLMLLALFSVGCKTEPKPDNDEVEVTIEPPDPLTVLVVGDPTLGPVIKRQWAARRDGVLTIVDKTIDDFCTDEFIIPENIDVAIYPPAMLGELCAAKQIMKIPSDIYNSDEFNKNELLRHFRTLVVRHDDQNFAVPLGSPGYSMILNKAVLEKAQTEAPITWAKMDLCLRDISKSLEAEPNETLQAKVDMPLAEGWAVHTFLARAAPSIAERGKLSTVMDRQTMKPLITQLPFVDSLKQLKEIASKRSLELDPSKVYDLVCKGETTLAIGWPATGFLTDSDSEESEIPLATELQIVSLPGVTERYDPSSGNWTKREDNTEFRVDTIGFSGFVASVSDNTYSDESCWELLTWLSSKQISLLTMPKCKGVGPFRASHLGDSGVWTGERISDDIADEYSEVIAANHDRAQAMIFPRITGHQKYLDVLDEAVRDCVSGTKSEEEALESAAQKWDEITEQLGRKAQIENLKMTRAL